MSMMNRKKYTTKSGPIGVKSRPPIYPRFSSRGYDRNLFLDVIAPRGFQFSIYLPSRHSIDHRQNRGGWFIIYCCRIHLISFRGP